MTLARRRKNGPTNRGGLICGRLRAAMRFTCRRKLERLDLKVRPCHSLRNLWSSFVQDVQVILETFLIVKPFGSFVWSKELDQITGLHSHLAMAIVLSKTCEPLSSV